MYKFEDVFLNKYGLSVDTLEKLSYKSKLGISLKKNLHYFTRQDLLNELFDYSAWLNAQSLLDDVAIDFRIKSFDSIELKYERYDGTHQVKKVFNDILGFRASCDSYNSVYELGKSSLLKLADMSLGKANDDGYRGVHMYFQIDNSYYPIEIQFNTLYDRQMNNWLHAYVYKHGYNDSLGRFLRSEYESGHIRNESEFKEALNYALSRNEEA